MNNHLLHYQSIEGPFIHFTTNPELFQQLYDELRETRSNELFVITIDGKSCSTKQALFHTFASALQFPDYFGHNWDAFSECLNDLSWLDCDQYVLFLKNVDDMLEKDIDERNIFLDILEEAVDEWTSGVDYDMERLPTPFHVVIHATQNIAVEINNTLRVPLHVLRY